jgi:hypothetical protein
MISCIYRQTVVSLALILCAPLYAAEEIQANRNETPGSAVYAASSQIDPFVDVLIRQASDYLLIAKSFSLHSDTTIEEVSSSGQKIQLSRSAEVLVRQPDRLRAEVVSDRGVTRFYYDGKTMSRFDLDQNVYASIDVPDNLEAALDHAMERFQIDAPLADLFAGNLYSNFIENTDSAFYAGLHYLEGSKYHHLALSNENVDFQIWISDSVAPLIHKIVITYKHLVGAPQFTAILSDWNFNPDAPDMVFDFYPPIDADEIEFLPVTTSASGAEK